MAAGEPTGSSHDSDREGDPALVATEGTVDGGKFRFQASHFEWLLRFGQSLGLTFDDMGKRRHGFPSTLFFCDELFRLYGSDDYNQAMGAAFAVENWAAAGFWKELIAGLERMKATRVPDMPLAFFTWHDKIEEQHKEHVWEELSRGRRIAVVFTADTIPAAGSHLLWPDPNATGGSSGKRVLVVNGVDDDVRSRDPAGSLVALKWIPPKWRGFGGKVPRFFVVRAWKHPRGHYLLESHTPRQTNVED
jgi:hypothetical protein